MLFPVLALTLACGPAQGTPPSFPPASPIAAGVDPAAVDALHELVGGLVSDGEVVGAELLLIVDGHSILHEAYGWADREAGRRLEPGALFCVRSMTKPVVGTAALMMLQEGRLELDTRVAEHLPGFDRARLDQVTVEHLLTHTSGLPLSLLAGRDLGHIDGIGAVAALGAEFELTREPGSAFEYSDQGTDTLTALLEVVSGVSARELIEERVLEPLGMGESTTVLDLEHPLRARALVKYAGGPDAWEPFWHPDEPPLFPFFLGSQGLYSTTTDYARFCRFWLAKGRAEGERLLKPSWVRKALDPRHGSLGRSTGFDGLDNDYGWLMTLWTREEPPRRPGGDPEHELVVFGHTGSDGTHAWIFPEHDAIALYFTQSRGTTSGLQVEQALGRIFLGDPFDPAALAPPVDPYLGYYFEGEGDVYRAVVRHEDGMALEILGRAVVPLEWAGEDSWRLSLEPGTVLEFQRDAEGNVDGYRIGEHREYRFEPSTELPDVDELVARISATHGLERLATLGPMRRAGSLRMPNLGREGTLETVHAWPDRFREDAVSGEARESLAIDGDEVWLWSSERERAAASGPEFEALVADHSFVHFGDWSSWYPTVTIVQRIDEADGDSGLLVRAGDLSGPAPTYYVEAETATVVGVDRMTYVRGLGQIGCKTRWGDFRDVQGLRLPFACEITYASPLLGTIELRLEQPTFGDELEPGYFALTDRD